MKVATVILIPHLWNYYGQHPTKEKVFICRTWAALGKQASSHLSCNYLPSNKLPVKWLSENGYLNLNFRFLHKGLLI